MFLLWLYPQTHQLAIFTYSMKRVAFACNQGLALLGFFPYAILFSQSQINNPDPQMFFFYEKITLWPFLWMGFNCLKARTRTTLRRQFTFYHQLSSQELLVLIFYRPQGQTTQILKSYPKKEVSVVAKMLFPQVDEGFWLYTLVSDTKNI